MIHTNLRPASAPGATIFVVNREREMEAFDRLPRSLKRVLQDADVPIATCQLEGLLEKWPADVLAQHLRNEQAKRLKAARDRILSGKPPP